MTQFHFVARDPHGQTERGTREAPSDDVVIDELRARGLITLEVLVARRSLRKAPARLIGSLTSAAAWLCDGFGPRAVHVEVSLHQIACMIRSELTLLSALRTCAEQSTSGAMRRVWLQVGSRIQDGAKLSDALAEHRCFPPLVVAMASIGEEIGEIETVLVRAANTLERRRTLRTNAMTALFYPCLVLVMAVGVVAYMMLGVVPRLESFLTAAGRQLPPLTRALVTVSDFFQSYAVRGGVLLATALAIFAVTYTWLPVRRIVDRAVLEVPVFCQILKLSATATFARAMAALLESGVRLTEALRIIEPLHKNRHIAERIALCRARVLQGGAFSEPLAECAGFYPMLSSMVAVGESSGTLGDVLEQVADFHESRLEALIRRLSAIIEPVITIVVGGVVAFVYLAFFMAIYSIIGK